MPPENRVVLRPSEREAALKAEILRLQAQHRAFVDGLTDALNSHGVPAMPSWREAIDYLARHGGSAPRPFCPACDLNVNACTCDLGDPA